MRKFLRLTIPAVVAALLVATFASAGPGLGISIDTNSMKGTGSNGNPIGLRTTCAVNEILKWSGSAWGCSSDNGGLATGDIDGITTAASSGMTGGCVSGTCILTLLTTCSANQILKWSGSAWACAADSDTGDITGVTAGAGISGGGTSGTVTVTANLAGASCSAGNYMSAISSVGTGTCTAEVGDISSVGATANMGLTGGGTSGAVTLGLLSTCANGQVLKSGSSGTTWTCANDDVTAVSGTTNYIAKFTSSSAVGNSTVTDDGTTVTIFKSLNLGSTTGYASGTLSSGTTENWNPSGLASATVIRVTTDTFGSTLGGLTGKNVGDIVVLENHGDGSGSRSNGDLKLLHRSAGSSAANVFVLSDLTDVIIPYTGSIMLYYDGVTVGWIPFAASQGGRFERITTNQIDIPVLEPTALAAGNNNDWNPTGMGTHSYLRFLVNTGAILTGMNVNLIAGYSPGAVKILQNAGSVSVLISDEDTNSLALNRFSLPNGSFLLPPKETLVVIYDFTAARWKVLSTPHWSSKLSLYTSITDTSLGATVSNYNPTGLAYTSRLRLAPSGGSTNLTGLTAQEDGAIRTLTSYGAGLTLKHQSTSSTPANRFYLPGAVDMTLAVGGSITLVYDATFGAWFSVTDPASGGATITGSGTANTTTKWTGATAIGNAWALDDGTTWGVSSKFTITEASGNTSVGGTLDATGDTSVNTNKFTVQASTGNTAVAGTFSVAGTSTLGDSGTGDKVIVKGGEFADGGTAPSSSTCGTSPTYAGGRNWFRITAGTGGPTTCAVTFSTAFDATPICTVTAQGSAKAVYITALSASSITFSNTGADSMTGIIYNVMCGGDG